MQTPLWADTPWADTPWADTSLGMATEVSSMHPTGIHSCHLAKWLAHLTAMWGILPIESGILPLLKHACEEVTDCHADCQEVSRCHTRGKSQGMFITYASTKYK